MKSLDKIAAALVRIAVALENRPNVQAKPIEKKTPSPYKNTTTTSTANVNYYSSHYITQQEKSALDSIYKALTDTGSHPKHHQHMMRELKNKWPILHTALMSLVTAKLNSYTTYSETRKIWNSEGN